MIYAKPPSDFVPTSHAVGVLLKCGEEILLLKRDDRDKFWGQPAGRQEDGESALDAVIRETKEETGIELQKDKIRVLKTFYVRNPRKDFTFTVFGYELAKKPEIVLCHEHSEYRWIKPEDMAQLDIIPDGIECIRDLS
jgi:8-oxo-dGTP pyrophosphatase MutT (NUDIX family)